MEYATQPDDVVLVILRFCHTRIKGHNKGALDGRHNFLLLSIMHNNGKGVSQYRLYPQYFYLYRNKHFLYIAR